MWAANLGQVHRKNPQGEDYDCWVLFLRLKTDTPIEESIRHKHEDIDEILAQQNVNYAEITTYDGKCEVYDKFNFREGRHPLFLILNKHSDSYEEGDPLMVVEWGKWPDANEMKGDLMALVNFFSDEDFRRDIANAKDENMWNTVVAFLERNAISIVRIGVTVATALA